MKPYDVTYRQISLGVKMALGARSFVGDGAALIFQVGPGRPLWKVVVTLNGRDLYDIELLRFDRHFNHTVVASHEDVGVENLNATLISLQGNWQK